MFLTSTQVPVWAGLLDPFMIIACNRRSCSIRDLWPVETEKWWFTYNVQHKGTLNWNWNWICAILHVTFLQLEDFPLQLLVLHAASYHPSKADFPNELSLHLKRASWQPQKPRFDPFRITNIGLNSKHSNGYMMCHRIAGVDSTFASLQ